MPWQQTRLVAFPWQKKRTSELRMIDVLLAQDEIHMVRYRLELHAPVTERVIIAEAEWTHTGQRKPLHVREALTAAEIDQYKIHLCVINFSASALLHVQKLANRSKYGHNVGGSHPQHSFLHLRKLEQRIQLNQVVVAELRTLRARQTSINAPTRLVHFSDVDELLDIRMLQSTHASLGNRSWPSCSCLHLKVLMYSANCHASQTRWYRSVLMRDEWLLSALARAPQLELRMGHAVMSAKNDKGKPVKEILSKACHSLATESYLGLVEVERTTDGT